MTPLALPVGDPGSPKSPGAFDLVVHFLEWKNRLLEQCIKICTEYLPVQMRGEGGNEVNEVDWGVVG